MNDMLSQIEEIQSNVREIKATWDNTIMTLDNIKTDRQKAIDDAYDRGLNDAWGAAMKINIEAVHGGYSTKTLEEVFGTPSNCTVMRKFSVKEAIQKINEYEGEIRVGDEVQFGSFTFVVTAYNKETGLLSGFDHKGITYAGIGVSRVKKTGRGIDMVSLLEELRE